MLKIYFWSGMGYQLNNPIKVNEYTDLDALEKAASIAIKEDQSIIYDKVGDLTPDEIEELEASDTYIYLDLTPYDLDCYYVLIENLKIESEE